MQVTALRFNRQAKKNLRNARLQSALSKIQVRFVQARAEAIADLDDYAAVRQRATAIREGVLADLGAWLERFEQEATRRGAVVHWAETAADVNRIVIEIAQANHVKKAIKSKSMVSEECALNDALEAAGVQVMETDLGEYILQLAHEAPSHIVAPVLHKTKDEISDLFAEKHQLARKTGIAELCREAREILRPH